MTMDIPTTLAVDLRHAFKRYQDAETEWADAVLALAIKMAEARVLFLSNGAFSAWLTDNALGEFNDHERAALIQMGQHPEITREVLVDTPRRSIRLLWEQQIRDRVGSAANTPPPPPETPESPVTTGETAPAVPVDPPATAARMSRSPLAHLPQAALVIAHVLNPATRTFLGQLMKHNNNRPIWDLLVRAIQEGAYGPAVSATVKEPTIRLIFPWVLASYTKRLNLRSASDRAVVERMIPLVLAQPTLLSDPRQFSVVTAPAFRVPETTPATPVAPVRRAAAAQGPEAVIGYGVQLWPPLEGQTPTYDRQTLLEACWFFQFFIRQLDPDMSTKTRELQTYPVLKWIPPRGETPWKTAVRAVAQAYGQQPDGPCHIPPPQPE